MISKARLETPLSASIRVLSSTSTSLERFTGTAVIPRADIMGRTITISPVRPSSSIGNRTVGHCQISWYKSCDLRISITIKSASLRISRRLRVAVVDRGRATSGISSDKFQIQRLMFSTSAVREETTLIRLSHGRYPETNTGYS